MKKFGSQIARSFYPYSRLIKWVGYLINIVNVVVLGMWIWNWKISFSSYSFDHEPLLIGLTMLYAGLNQINRWIFKEAEYSPAYALAIGYFSNFISPVITQLLESGEKSPVLYVYKPENLSELYRDNLDRVNANIKNRDFELDKLNLESRNARARDVLIVQKSKTKKVYFDMPNTLTSLVNYIDFKVGSKENSSSEKDRQAFTNELIQKFYERLDELMTKENIAPYVRYCDKELKFDF